MIRKARSYGSAEEKQATQSARLTTAVLIVLGIAAFFFSFENGIIHRSKSGDQRLAGAKAC